VRCACPFIDILGCKFPPKNSVPMFGFDSCHLPQVVVACFRSSVILESPQVSGLRCARGRRGDSSPDFRSLVLRDRLLEGLGGPRDPTLSLTVCARDRESQDEAFHGEVRDYQRGWRVLVASVCPPKPPSFWRLLPSRRNGRAEGLNMCENQHTSQVHHSRWIKSTPVADSFPLRDATG